MSCLLKSLVNAIEVEVRRDDVIVVEQEDELGFCGVDRCVATNANSHIVPVEVDHVAMLGRLGILLARIAIRADRHRRRRSWAGQSACVATEPVDGRTKDDESS